MEARDRFGALRCQVPGCRSTIKALTGLQEIDKLAKHMARVHLSAHSPRELLELRAAWEDRADAERKVTPHD